jgi:hypothetical protein
MPAVMMREALVMSEKTEINHQFTEWLAGAYGFHFKCKLDGYHITFFRVQKNGAFDYLYCQRNFCGTGIERDVKFEYAGIYYKIDGLIFDVHYNIRGLMPVDDDYETRSLESLAKRLKFHVCRSVEKMVGNDRNNLRIRKLSSEQEIKKMEDFKAYEAAKQARNVFLESSGNECDGDFSFVYNCRYSPQQWTEDSVLTYILDPDGYSDMEAMNYFDDNQEYILADFLKNDFVIAEYKELANNPQYAVHHVKCIMQAMKSSSAKMVNVTVCINNIEFTFKTEASEFRRDCTSYYSDWNIAAADRQEFQRIYGRGTHYKPEDVLRIEYSRKILYFVDADSVMEAVNVREADSVTDNTVLENEAATT